MRKKLVAIALACMLSVVCIAGCGSSNTTSSDNDPEVAVVEEPSTPGPEPEEEPAEAPEVDPTPESEADSHEVLISEAEAEGRIVITGTLRIMTATELCELYDELPDGFAENFGGDESRYAIVVFDEPQMLAVMHSGDYGTPYEGEASMVAVAIDENNEWGHEGDMSLWEPYDGQVVTVSIDPNEAMFPSDVRLPLGDPHTSTAELLFAE